jgi:hypothetical protein
MGGVPHTAAGLRSYWPIHARGWQLVLAEKVLTLAIASTPVFRTWTRGRPAAVWV